MKTPLRVQKSNVHQNIVANVRDLGLKKQITQERLALEANLNRAYIGYIELDERKSSVVTLVKLVKVLGVKIRELFLFD